MKIIDAAPTVEPSQRHGRAACQKDRNPSVRSSNQVDVRTVQAPLAALKKSGLNNENIAEFLQHITGATGTTGGSAPNIARIMRGSIRRPSPLPGLGDVFYDQLCIGEFDKKIVTLLEALHDVRLARRAASVFSIASTILSLTSMFDMSGRRAEPAKHYLLGHTYSALAEFGFTLDCQKPSDQFKRAAVHFVAAANGFKPDFIGKKSKSWDSSQIIDCYFLTLSAGSALGAAFAADKEKCELIALAQEMTATRYCRAAEWLAKDSKRADLAYNAAEITALAGLSTEAEDFLKLALKLEPNLLCVTPGLRPKWLNENVRDVIHLADPLKKILKNQ